MINGDRQYARTNLHLLWTRIWRFYSRTKPRRSMMQCRPNFEIKTNTFHSDTTFLLSRRCFPSSIRVPKIVLPRMASVYVDTRSPHNGGGTFESGYTEPMTKWRRSDGYFKVTNRHPARAGQRSPPPRLGREVPGRRKGPRRSSPHSESWRRNSRVLLNNHPCLSRPRYPR